MPTTSRATPVSNGAVAAPTVAASSTPIEPPPIHAAPLEALDPRFARHPTFVGAALPIAGFHVLIVCVQPWILADAHESNLYVVAFQMRFQRVIVLMAQDERRVPTFWGPAVIVRALCKLPFEMIPWQRMQYRVARRATWQLPIPPARSPEASTAETTFASISSLRPMSEDERMARTTKR